MTPINILYIGRHPEILQTVVRLINNNKDWNAVGFEKDEDAKAAFVQKNFSIVLLGSGIDYESEVDLRTFFGKQNPEAIIIQHYGGGSGLLNSEILIALQK